MGFVPLTKPRCYTPTAVSHYGVFLDLTGRPCTVIGGGDIAARKVDGLLRAGARVTVIAPRLVDGLARLAANGAVEHWPRTYHTGDLRGAFLGIEATDDPESNRAIAAEARECGILLNVVDQPRLCTFIAPALLERGDLQIAVSTAGAAPAYAARVRDRIAELLGAETADVLRILRTVRERLRASDRSAAERRRILVELAASDLADRIRAGDRGGVDRLLGEIVGPGASLDGLGVALD